MPSSTQIIPKYIHPHVEVYINDNTEYVPETAQSEQGIRSLHVFASRKGRDGQIVSMRSTSEFVKEFGQPDYKRFGQPNLMPYGALTSEQAECYCLRVMPADATYANLMVYARYKWVTAGSTETITVLNPDYDPSLPPTATNPKFPTTTNDCPVTATMTPAEVTVALRDMYPSEPLVVGNPFFDPATPRTEVIMDPVPDILTATGDIKTKSHTIINIYHSSLTPPTTNIWADPTIADVTRWGNILFDPLAIEFNLPERTETVTYANETLIVRYQKDTLDTVTKPGETAPLWDAHNQQDVADAEGWFETPVFVIVAQGRGSYGDYKRIRLTDDVQSNKSSKFARYIMEVLDADQTLTQEEIISRGALSDENTVVSGVSYFFPDLINDPERGSTVINMELDGLAMDALFAKYNENANRIVKLPLSTYNCSILNFQQHNGNIVPDISIDNRSIGTISLSSVNGIGLGGGNDGALFNGQLDGAAYDDALSELYSKAFRGEYDRSILSKRRTPCEFIYDANYDFITKSELAKMIIQRGDAQGFLDFGILNDTLSLESAILQPKVEDRIISYECQNFNMRDPFNGKRINLTTTYELARRLPGHVKTYGAHIPFTGADKARITGMIRNEFWPVVDGDDGELKEKLYEARVNYYEAIGENFFMRGTQSTSQNIWSDLSEENNMRTLLQIKREIENMVSSLAYDFADEEQRKLFTESADRLLDKYRGQVREATVYFDMNDFEEERYILHCYLSIVFKTMAKIGIIEIDINPRV